MTSLQLIYQDPQDAFYKLIDSKEKNSLFTKLKKVELKKYASEPYNTPNSIKATKRALITMYNLNQL